MRLVKIAEVNADSNKSTKDLMKTLEDNGYYIVAQEGYPDSFYICIKVED